MAHLPLKFYQSSENHTTIVSTQIVQHHPVGIASFWVEASFRPQEVSCVRRSDDSQNSDLSTGYVGSENTVLYLDFNLTNYYFANYSYLPTD